MDSVPGKTSGVKTPVRKTHHRFQPAETEDSLLPRGKNTETEKEQRRKGKVFFFCCNQTKNEIKQLSITNVTTK